MDCNIKTLYQQTLGMTLFDCHEKSLGLPFFMGCDKSLLISDIKEKVLKLL